MVQAREDHKQKEKEGDEEVESEPPKLIPIQGRVKEEEDRDVKVNGYFIS